MAYISLKISNVIDNIDVLKLRLSSIKNRQNFVKKLLLLFNEGNTDSIEVEELSAIRMELLLLRISPSIARGKCWGIITGTPQAIASR